MQASNRDRCTCGRAQDGHTHTRTYTHTNAPPPPYLKPRRHPSPQPVTSIRSPPGTPDEARPRLRQPPVLGSWWTELASAPLCACQASHLVQMQHNARNAQRDVRVHECTCMYVNVYEIHVPRHTWLLLMGLTTMQPFNGQTGPCHIIGLRQCAYCALWCVHGCLTLIRVVIQGGDLLRVGHISEPLEKRPRLTACIFVQANKLAADILFTAQIENLVQRP